MSILCRFIMSRRREEGQQGSEGAVDRERRFEREAILPLVLCLDILVFDNPTTSDPSVRVAVDHILELPGLG